MLFNASVKNETPALNGKPVIIGGGRTRRGIDRLLYRQRVQRGSIRHADVSALQKLLPRSGHKFKPRMDAYVEASPCDFPRP